MERERTEFAVRNPLSQQAFDSAAHSRIARRTKMTTTPRTGPIKNPTRQPQLIGTWLENRYRPRPDPIAALMAVYSPPIRWGKPTPQAS
jgi:hypothetical protein